jgi:hypothetical protein
MTKRLIGSARYMRLASAAAALSALVSCNFPTPETLHASFDQGREGCGTILINGQHFPKKASVQIAEGGQLFVTTGEATTPVPVHTVGTFTPAKDGTISTTAIVQVIPPGILGCTASSTQVTITALSSASPGPTGASAIVTIPNGCPVVNSRYRSCVPLKP